MVHARSPRRSDSCGNVRRAHRRGATPGRRDRAACPDPTPVALAASRGHGPQIARRIVQCSTKCLDGRAPVVRARCTMTIDSTAPATTTIDHHRSSSAGQSIIHCTAATDRLATIATSTAIAKRAERAGDRPPRHPQHGATLQSDPAADAASYSAVDDRSPRAGDRRPRTNGRNDQRPAGASRPPRRRSRRPRHRNELVAIGDGAYLEIIGPDLAQVDHSGGRPFGVGGRSGDHWWRGARDPIARSRDCGGSGTATRTRPRSDHIDVAPATRWRAARVAPDRSTAGVGDPTSRPCCRS